MKKHFNNKLTIVVLLMLQTLVFVSSYLIWNFCLDGGDCKHRIVNSILRPLYYSSLALIGYFTFFIFLPSRYFWLWLTWIFSWGFPVSVLIVLQNIDSGGGVFPIYAREVIILLSAFFAVVTGIFLAIVYWRSHKKQ